MDFLFHRKVRLFGFVFTGALLAALLCLCACSPKDSFTLTLGGDVMLARGGQPLASDWQSIDLRAPEELLANSDRDFYAANLESPLAPDAAAPAALPAAEMNLCAPAEMANVLKNAGMRFLTSNNNHQNDCISDGAQVTNAALEAAGFPSAVEAEGLWLTRLADANLSVIAVNEVSQPLAEEAVVRLIQQEKEQGRFVVVSAHWGNEYQAGPDRQQQTLAQSWVDAGADLIWGHHPHVLQRMEWLTSGVDGHQALVMYSLGNLLADQWMLPDAQRSALVQVQVRQGRISGVTLVPVIFDWQNLSLQYSLDGTTRDKIIERLALSSTNHVKVEIYSAGD